MLPPSTVTAAEREISRLGRLAERSADIGNLTLQQRCSDRAFRLARAIADSTPQRGQARPSDYSQAHGERPALGSQC